MVGYSLDVMVVMLDEKNLLDFYEMAVSWYCLCVLAFFAVWFALAGNIIQQQ